MTTTAEPTLEEIKDALARFGFIANLWHIDDVRQERPDLTKEQAWSVLQACEDRQDANIGINWEVIQMHADHLFPEPLGGPRSLRYEVQTAMLTGWENCWTDGGGNAVTFATRAEAEEAIRDHIADCLDAVENGDMVDSPNLVDLRVVEVAR